MRIDFSGSCTVQRMEELQQTVRDAANDPAAKVELGFAGVEDVDLSFFQLLHGVRRSFAAKGKDLIFLEDLPPALAPKARLCGFSQWAATLKDASADRETEGARA